ncbi:MAG TPA: HPP family protein [Acidobacteriaceae bacterium]|nr:HPP family protein [Acidobacteriaceae bacterium]
MQRRDLIIAPAGEAALILVAAAVGWATRQPLIFASLGPTAYELIETPERRSAQPYCVFVGHLVGVGAGFLAVWATGAWSVAPVSAAGVPAARVWSATLAAALTVLGTLLLRASQPAATSTTLLVALGLLQSPRDAGLLMAGVVLMTILGEPLRRLRLRSRGQGEGAQEPRSALSGES